MSSVPHSKVTDAESPHKECRIQVLLVDDHALIADNLRAIFEPHDDIGFFYCSDPASALKVASRIRPTVIFQDLIMPGKNGLDLVREFRAAPDLGDIPIVMLSSKDEPATKEAAFAAGADDYLVKLPDEIELIARVRYHSRSYLAHLDLQQTVVELNKAHDQLFQSEKMASVGVLAAGVAHEINNPIAFVTSNLNSLNDYHRDMFKVLDAYAAFDDGSPDEGADVASVVALKQQLQIDDIREDVGQILEECKDGLARVRRIVDDLKGFSRTSETEWQWADMHKELDRTLSIASNEIKYHADVVKIYGDLPQIQCIPSQINQVFLNLLVNAAHAMESRGQITITTLVATVPKDLEPQAGDDDEWACIKVADTGPGIDADTLSRIFEPFFTTKVVGKGTGLGLSVSYGIIQSHNGHIIADSEPGLGTTFTIWLPVNQNDD